MASFNARDLLNRYVLKSRYRLKKYLRGEGIEIGALHNPLDISNTAVTKISYVDRLPVDELYRQYPELRQYTLLPVDIVDDGAKLATIPDNSLDFIIANQLIEHMANPIQALENWYCRLRPGGILFLAVPDKRLTFDKDRALTSLRHLVNDYYASEESRRKRDYHHYVEHVEDIMKKSGKEAEQQVNDLISMDYSIHYHVWDFHSFQTFLRSIATDLGIPYKTIDYSVVYPLKKEFIFILQK